MTSDEGASEPDEATASRIRDVKSLLDLLDLLPVPDEDDAGDFWAEFAAVHPERLEPSYIVGKLAVHIEQAHNQPDDAYTGHQLAEYCLIFFDGDNQPMWDLINRSTAGGVDSGRRLARSICDTAWRIFVPTYAASRREGNPARRHAQTVWKMRNDMGRDQTDT